MPNCISTSTGGTRKRPYLNLQITRIRGYRKFQLAAFDWPLRPPLPCGRQRSRLRCDQAVPGPGPGGAEGQGQGSRQALVPALTPSEQKEEFWGTAVEAADRHKFLRHLKAWGDAHTGPGIRFIYESDALDDPDNKGFWTTLSLWNRWRHETCTRTITAQRTSSWTSFRRASSRCLPRSLRRRRRRRYSGTSSRRRTARTSSRAGSALAKR